MSRPAAVVQHAPKLLSWKQGKVERVVCQVGRDAANMLTVLRMELS